MVQKVSNDLAQTGVFLLCTCKERRDSQHYLLNYRGIPLDSRKLQRVHLELILRWNLLIQLKSNLLIFYDGSGGILVKLCDVWFADSSADLGTFCGDSVPGQVTSSFNKMRITFHSDNTSAAKGFLLWYGVVSPKQYSELPTPQDGE